jgi:hypothetical protein
MTDPTRPALEALRREFLRASSMYPPLYHQRLVDLYQEDAETVDAWRAFAAANTSKDWQIWHGPVFGQDAWFGRFCGNGAGLTEFKQLADSLYSVIREIDPRWDAEDEEGKWGGSFGSRASGFETCLDLLHTIAICWPTQLIRSEASQWCVGEEHVRKKQAIGTEHADDEESTNEELEKLNELDALEESVATGESGVVYLVHPWVDTIQTNLFSACVALIDMILDDAHAFFISDGHFSEPDYPRLGQGELIAESESINTKQDAAPAETKGDYLFAFDARRRQWHVRFRWGSGTAEVEEDWIPHKKEVEYVAFVLERPQEWIPCIEILPPPRDKESRSAISSEEAFSEKPTERRSGRARDDDPEDRKTWMGMKRKIADLNAKLAEVRAKSGEEAEAEYMKEEAEYEDELEKLKKIVNLTWDKYGRRRESVTTEDNVAATRVRNAIDRFVLMVAPWGKHPLPHLYQHLRYRKDRRKTIDVSKGLCSYNPRFPPLWKVVPLPK